MTGLDSLSGATTTLLNATIAAGSTTTTLAEAVKNPLVDLINLIINVRFNQSWALLGIPLVLAVLVLYARRTGISRKNIGFFALRSLFAILAIIAIASPQLYESEVQIKETPMVRILLDETQSMTLYGNQTVELAQRLRTELISTISNKTQASDKISIDIISSAEKTSIGDELYRIMTTTEENGIIILMSDGNSNYGKDPVDVARQIGKVNTTIYAIAVAPNQKDVYLKDIRGDSKVTTPLDYQGEVEIASTGNQQASYKLSVYADSSKIVDMQITQNSSSKDIPLKFSFAGIGVHKITAEIKSDSASSIEVNDVMMKTVEVVEKPRILMVTNKTSSPLLTVLNELYSVDLSDRLRTKLEDYNLVYFDDVNGSSISSSNVEALREYVLNGNGLIVVGGKKSYDYGNYNNSYFETLLPVASMEKPAERRKQIAVVILMDISGSTEYGVSEDYRMTSKIDFEKALAIKILRSLDINDSLGVIAFNTLPYTIAIMDRLGERRTEIENDLIRLRFGGGTDMLNSIDAANKMLSYYAVDKYVILLSDGVIRTSRMPQTIEKVRSLTSNGIRVYTVGVGFDTDENFMQALAQAGKGVYFKPEAYQRLNIEFGRGLEEETPGLYAVDVRDEYHFITRNINLTAKVSGFNKVNEKAASQLLLATKSGNPILTVWNFGLGRVAALTSDDGLSWAGGLYQEGNSRIISSTTNWALGDLEKNKKVRVKTSDARLGETTIIRIDSPSRPEVWTGKGDEKIPAEVKATGLNTYAVSFKPNETGFYTVTARSQQGIDSSGISVNYPEEYLNLALNLDELSAIATSAGGRLYYDSELEELKEETLEKMKELSTKNVIKERPLYPYIIALILGLYFLDVVVRRIRDIRRLSV